MRLKRLICSWVSRSCGPWKDKTLDYEIETRRTRPRTETRPSAWKDKTLDYEIETCGYCCGARQGASSWKEKTLDYEIETRKSLTQTRTLTRHLKREDSRLRDWNVSVCPRCCCCFLILKREDSRLRDWNDIPDDGNDYWVVLEKIRLSITRLKRGQFQPD